MEKSILDFSKQLAYAPQIKNEQFLKLKEAFVVGGMGGSHLGAGLLKMREPHLDLVIHRDYGLPPLSSPDLESRLFIASSYSGNTEETLDFAEEARKNKLDVAVVATGGKLIDFARLHQLPYITIPETGIQPRLALGFSMRALAKFMKRENVYTELQKLSDLFRPETFREKGRKLSENLSGKIPVIYASTSDMPLAYNWKIKFNETGKIPAFYNVFPELNHNEMTGFDRIPSTEGLSSQFHFIFLINNALDSRIARRMEICGQMLKERNFSITSISLEGDTFFERIFNSLILADWTAYYTAVQYGAEPEQVPMVEEFKKRLENRAPC